MICNRRAFVLATGCPQVSVNLSFPDLEFCSDPQYTDPHPCDQCVPKLLPSPDVNFPGAQRCFSINVSIDKTIEYAKDATVGTARLTSSDDCVSNNYSLYIGFKAPCILKNITIGELLQLGGRYNNHVIGELAMNKTVCVASLEVNITGISKIAFAVAPPRVNICPEITFTGSIGISAPNIRFSFRAASFPDMSHGTKAASVCRLSVLFNFKAYRPKPKKVEIEYIPHIVRGRHEISGPYTLKHISEPEVVKWARGEYINLPDPVTLYLTAESMPFIVNGGPGEDWVINWKRPGKKITGPTGTQGDRGPYGASGEPGNPLDDPVICEYYRGWGRDKHCGPEEVVTLRNCDDCLAPCDQEILNIDEQAASFDYNIPDGFGDFAEGWYAWFSCPYPMEAFDQVGVGFNHEKYGPFFNNPAVEVIGFCPYMKELHRQIRDIFD